VDLGYAVSYHHGARRKCSPNIPILANMSWSCPGSTLSAQPQILEEMTH
jgi:hypothetical protein